MKISYDALADAMLLTLNDDLADDTAEIAPGISVCYDQYGAVVAIEILDASRLVDDPAHIEFLASPR